jgi:hypothetical protein
MYNNYNPNEDTDLQFLSDIRAENNNKVKELSDYKKQINPILHPVDKLKTQTQFNKLSSLTKKVDKFNYNHYGRNPSILADIKSAMIAHKIKNYQKKYGEDSINPVIHRNDISLFSITEVNLIDVR